MTPVGGGGGGGGGGGFFLASEDLGEGLSIHSLPALFCFVFEVEFSLHTPISPFSPGSELRQLWLFPDESHVSELLFPDRFPHYA